MSYDLSRTPQGQKAETIQSTFRQQSEYVRGNKKLTDTGKRQQLAQVYLEAKRQLDALAANVQQQRETRVSALRRDLFGAAGTSDPQRAISFRDAQERVNALQHGDSAKAAKLLDQAELSGDDVMVKAVIQRSLEMSWADVANQYIEKHPYYGQKLEELWGLSEPTDGIDTVGLMNAMVFQVSKPGELAHLWDDKQLEAVANGD